jgi:hypothetical protein
MKTFFLPRVLAFSLLGLLFVTVGCKKSDDAVTPVADNNTPAFVDKNLRISAVTSDPLIDMDGDGKVDKDLMAFLRPCDTDNTIRFEKSGRLSGNSGAIDCNPNDNGASDTKPGTWTYDAKTHILRLITGSEGNQNVAEWEVLEASTTGLKAKIGTQDSSDQLKLIMTWKAQ